MINARTEAILLVTWVGTVDEMKGQPVIESTMTMSAEVGGVCSHAEAIVLMNRWVECGFFSRRWHQITPGPSWALAKEVVANIERLVKEYRH